MKYRSYSKMPKVVIHGSDLEMDAAEKALDQDVRLARFVGPNGEAAVRVHIAVAIAKYKLKATILYDGNQVWSRERILADVGRILKKNERNSPLDLPMYAMTNYLYKFLTLCCGSIAHYNMLGWIDEYPTVEALKKFFIRNEFGQHVYDYVPKWKPDVRDIVSAIEAVLGVEY